MSERERSTVGRPRDPGIEAKVTAAAVRVYARDGWNGVTFDAVAREAGVGKPAIYRRWSSRAELLMRAIDTMHFPAARDCGSLRADLLDFARQWVGWYADRDRGLVGARLWADAQPGTELHDLYLEIIAEPRVRAAREITRRAVARGEIGAGLHSGTAVDLLIGALGNHWLFTPASKLDKLHRTFEAHAERLVDVIVGGIHAVAPPGAAASGTAAASGAALPEVAAHASKGHDLPRRRRAPPGSLPPVEKGPQTRRAGTPRPR